MGASYKTDTPNKVDATKSTHLEVKLEILVHRKSYRICPEKISAAMAQ